MRFVKFRGRGKRRGNTVRALQIFAICLTSFALIFAQPICYTLNAVVLADEGTETIDADTSGLSTAITDAENTKKAVRPSTDGTDIAKDKLWAPQSAYNSLNASISAAKEIRDDPTHTQTDVNTQTAALNAAISLFNEACKYGTKSDDAEVTPEVVNALYLKIDVSGVDGAGTGKNHYAGEDSDNKYKTLSIETKGRTIQLNSYFTTNKSDGVLYGTADDTNPLGAVAIEWKSSDNNIATVSPNGLITAIADGEVTITATVAEEDKYDTASTAPSKSVQVNISGQSAEYVRKVRIIDEDGNSLSSEDDSATVIDGKNEFFSFYALITWHDPASDTDRIEDTREDAVTSTIKWSIGGSNVVATINEDTGRFKSTEYSGNCFVQCAVTGGVGGKTVKDTARIQVDTGEYAYTPSDSLTLKVVYQEFPDQVVQKHTYPLSDLAGRLSAVTNSYTVLGSSRYGVIRASGYLFKDVLALEGVEVDEVYQFRFTTADGYDNPVTSKFLYGSGSRYYFPNWDIGSRAGAVVVPPILATSSNMMWNESMIDPTTPLDEATRFRLVFGPLWGGESNSSYQIYYIQAITVVLSGAPPAENSKDKDKDDVPVQDNDKKDDDNVIVNKDDSNDNNISGAGNGAGTDSGDGSRNGGGNGSLTSDGTGKNGTDNARGSSQASTGDQGGTDPGANKDAAVDGDTKAQASVTGNTPFRSDGNFKIYEMISNAQSNVAPLNIDLPYLPAAGPLAGGCVIAGGISCFIGFRRRLL